MSTRVERFLESTNQRLWRSYEYVKRVCMEDECTRSLIGPPYYTDHGHRHSLRMVAMLDVLLFDPATPFLILRTLTDMEAYAILCAIFTHDLGMRGTSIDDKGQMLGQDATRLRTITREIHAQRSQYFLEERRLIKWDEARFPEHLRGVVGKICASHNASLVLLEKQNQEKANEKLDTAFCAAVLKVLDALDLSNRRIGLNDIRSEAIPSENRIHAWAHYYVDDVLLHVETKNLHSGYYNRISVMIRYSFPAEWESKYKNALDKSDVGSNPIYFMQVLAEKNIRASHTDVPEILKNRGIVLSLKARNPEILYSHVDVDGEDKVDFLKDFFNHLIEDEKKKVREVIQIAKNRYEGVLTPECAKLREEKPPKSMQSENGWPQCEETLQIILQLWKYENLRIAPKMYPDEKIYKIAFQALLDQKILRKDGDSYVLNKPHVNGLGLWTDAKTFLTKFFGECATSL